MHVRKNLDYLSTHIGHDCIRVGWSGICNAESIMTVDAVYLLQLTLNGITLGLIYALIAVGLSLIFGVMEIINFAHGELLMLGAFAMTFALPVMGLLYWPSLAVAILAIMLVGLVIYEVLLARLKESGVFSSVIGGSDIAAMVDMEQQKAALGCDDTNCLAELGGALGVPYLMDSSLSKVGNQFVLTLKILAVEDAKVAARKVAMVKDEAQLIASLEKIITEALSVLVQGKAPAAKAPAAAVPAVTAKADRKSVV